MLYIKFFVATVLSCAASSLANDKVSLTTLTQSSHLISQPLYYSSYNSYADCFNISPIYSPSCTQRQTATASTKLSSPTANATP